MNITRGDSKKVKFQRKNKQGEVITQIPDKMYITFKNNDITKDFLFQKTLEDGIVYDSETNYYSFTINPEDTNNLEYKTYYFDIEIIQDNYVKTIYKDKFKVESEITFTSNEG